MDDLYYLTDRWGRVLCLRDPAQELCEQNAFMSPYSVGDLNTNLSVARMTREFAEGLRVGFNMSAKDMDLLWPPKPCADLPRLCEAI